MLDGEIVRDAGADSTRSASASTPPSRGSSAWRAETPARFVAFDLLARGDEVLLELPYDERRAALEARRRPIELAPGGPHGRRGRALAARRRRA